MARSNDRDRKRKAPAKDLRKGKKKVCIFCTDKIDWVDYKDVNLLRRFLSERGKIRARRVSGNCSQHQAEVSVAIKTSRELALLPYVNRTLTERGRGGGRGGRGRDRDRDGEAPRGDRPDRGERPPDIEAGDGALEAGEETAELTDVVESEV